MFTKAIYCDGITYLARHPLYKDQQHRIINTRGKYAQYKFNFVKGNNNLNTSGAYESN